MAIDVFTSSSIIDFKRLFAHRVEYHFFKVLFLELCLFIVFWNEATFAIVFYFFSNLLSRGLERDIKIGCISVLPCP